VYHSKFGSPMTGLGQSRHKWQRPSLLLVRFAPKATEALQRGECRDVPIATLHAWYEMKETAN